jgi:flagellar motor protein MotB
MTIRSVVLGSASLSFAAVLSATSPGFAQSYGHIPQVSTPAEQAETQQLNQQSITGTSQSPAQLNGGAASSQDMAQADQAQENAQQEQYENQQQQYQDQQQRYQEQREQYRAQQHQYVRDLRRYDLARYAYTDYPRVYVYHYSDSGLRRLYLIADPTHQLAQVPVEGPSGRFIGKVRNIETAPDGRPRRVEVSLNRIVSVWVSPDHFRYDPADRVLFTDLSRDELWEMPGATVESDIYRP